MATKQIGLYWCKRCGTSRPLRRGLSSLQLANARLDGWQLRHVEGNQWAGHCPNCTIDMVADFLGLAV
jgi:hypothetical protein